MELEFFWGRALASKTQGEMPQVAAGCAPSYQKDTFSGMLKHVIFTSITQHATGANYMQMIICK